MHEIGLVAHLGSINAAFLAIIVVVIPNARPRSINRGKSHTTHQEYVNRTMLTENTRRLSSFGLGEIKKGTNLFFINILVKLLLSSPFLETSLLDSFLGISSFKIVMGTEMQTYFQRTRSQLFLNVDSILFTLTIDQS